jgi:hypothetical protein
VFICGVGCSSLTVLAVRLGLRVRVDEPFQQYTNLAHWAAM